MSRRKIWTEADIRALGARTDGVTACSIVYNTGRTKSYELLRRPEDLDFRVIRVPGSNRYVVATSEILRLLFPPADAPAAPSGDDSRVRLVADTSGSATWRRAG